MLSRRFFLVLFALLLPLAFACASAPTASGLQPQIEVRQLPRSEFDVEQQGAVSVAFQAVVHNPLPEPVTLRRITMQAVGRSPYRLRDTPVSLNETIEPGGDATVAFSMWAYPRTDASADLVWVKGTATFDSATGGATTRFSQSFRQPD